MLNKTEILKTCMMNFQKQVEELEKAAKSSASLATDAEHRAKSKYETFSLETSYLARGQAKRVVEMRETLSLLNSMELKTFRRDAEIQLGALVKVRDASGTENLYFIVPSGGGEEILIEGQDVLLVTPHSPVARALLKKRTGQTASFGNKTLNIMEIS